MVYKGQGLEIPNLARRDASGLIEALASPNLEVRRLAVNETVERLGKSAISPFSEYVSKWRVFERSFPDFKFPEDARKYQEGQKKAEPIAAALLAALTRLSSERDSLTPEEQATLSIFQSREVAHLYSQAEPVRLRSLASRRGYEGLSELDELCSIVAAENQPPLERRVAAESISAILREYLSELKLLADQPGPRGDEAEREPAYVELLVRCVRSLLVCWDYNPPEDAALTHAVRMALRDCLLFPRAYPAVAEFARINPQAAEHLAEVSLGAPTPAAADFLLQHLERTKFSTARAGEYVRHSALHLAETRISEIARLVAQLGAPPSFGQRLALADGLADAARKRPLKLPETAAAWIESTMLEALASPDPEILKRALAAVREYKSESKRAPLAKVAVDQIQRRDLRNAALEATANLPRAEELFVPILNDPRDLFLRRRAADLLGQIDSEPARAALLAALPTAPGELALSIAGALVQRESGTRGLLEAIAAGKGSPTLLRNKLVAMMIERKTPALLPQVGTLTADLPSEDARLDAAIAARVDAFHRASARRADIRPLDPEHGQQLYQQTCAACHRLKNNGGNVGPNLDGVAARGVHRLVEDILDPNRNVDPAFRQTVIETTDGRTIAGLNPREEGQLLLLNDATGAAVSVPRAQIKTRTSSRLSLMPPAFEQLLSPEDLNDLLAFLLNGG